MKGLVHHSEVKNLIFTILIKLKCIVLNIEYIDIGSKGILVDLEIIRLVNQKI